MTPAFTPIYHVNSNRSKFTPAAIATRKKGLDFVSVQLIREYPREVDIKRAERARKKLAKA